MIARLDPNMGLLMMHGGIKHSLAVDEHTPAEISDSFEKELTQRGVKLESVPW
jgi:hypothetical protein